MCKELGSCHNSSWIHKRREDTGQTPAAKNGEIATQMQELTAPLSRDSQAESVAGTRAGEGKP